MQREASHRLRWEDQIGHSEPAPPLCFGGCHVECADTAGCDFLERFPCSSYTRRPGGCCSSEHVSTIGSRSCYSFSDAGPRLRRPGNGLSTAPQPWCSELHGG